MSRQLIPIQCKKIMQGRSYTLFMLGTEEQEFAIYTEAAVGNRIQNHLTGKPQERPLTHSLLGSIFQGLNITPLQVVISDVEETIYFARLFLEQTQNEEKTILEIDARPSDCLTLALTNDLPIFAEKQVFEKTASVR